MKVIEAVLTTRDRDQHFRRQESDVLGSKVLGLDPIDHLRELHAP